MDSSKLPPPPPMNSGTLPSVPPPMSLKPGNHDRGWNDPPVFPVELNAVVKSAPTKLNKRVPYPGLTSSSPPAPSGFLESPLLNPPAAAVLQLSGNVNEEGGSRNLNTLMESAQSPTFGSRLGMLPSTSVEFIPTFPTPAPPPGNRDQEECLRPEGNNNEQESESESSRVIGNQDEGSSIVLEL